MFKKIGLSILVCCFAMIPLHVHTEKFTSISSSTTQQNPYSFISLLGKGEKAEVYLAQDPENRLVAIKCMSSNSPYAPEPAFGLKPKSPRSNSQKGGNIRLNMTPFLTIRSRGFGSVEMPAPVRKVSSKKQLRNAYPFTQEDLNFDKMFDLDGSSLIAKRELFISQQLQHPHILKIFEMYPLLNPATGERGDCLVMEYVKGQTLDKTPQKSQTNQQALQNALSLIDALTFAFSKNWIHYDLYSSNIMFDENQQIKLIDLDSFDELTDSNGDVTPIEYLDSVIFTIQQVLARGHFDDSTLQALSHMLHDTLHHSSYSNELNEPISSQSGALFSLVLKDMSTTLLHTSCLFDR